jgi:hypothetical protein
MAKESFTPEQIVTKLRQNVMQFPNGSVVPYVAKRLVNFQLAPTLRGS